MSVLIRGMEMPNRCLDCPLMVSRDNDKCIVQSEVANEIARTWEDLKANCPLIEVPPHGRLIDADALHDAMYHRAFETDGDTMWQSGCWVRFRAIEQVYESQPTIIEAEGSEE